MSWFKKGQAVRIDGIGRQRRMWAVVEEDLGTAVRAVLVDGGDAVNALLSPARCLITEEPEVTEGGLEALVVWMARSGMVLLPVRAMKDNPRVLAEIVVHAKWYCAWQEALELLADRDELDRVRSMLEAVQGRAHDGGINRLEAVRAKLAA